MNLKSIHAENHKQRISFFLQNLQKLYNHFKARSLTARYIKVNGDAISDVHFFNFVFCSFNHYTQSINHRTTLTRKNKKND